MTPTKESGIAKAAAGTGTWFASISGTSARVLLLAIVVFKSPGAAVYNQNVKYETAKKLVVQLREKLGDIDFCPEASFISR